MEIALKIDVDTHQGLGEGVPRLLRALTDLDVTATFLIAMGPDNAGRAIVACSRIRDSSRRCGGPAPSRCTDCAPFCREPCCRRGQSRWRFPNLMRELARAGFEVGVHGYDHVRWQDRLDEIGDAGIRS